ncbi:MAG: sensor domain-containing diguanylate cyclase [Lachnospiraceae bacterium]|nr:sensor domain-containing diguanylate cyclase [Lachnospiraceae bacterium]
MLWKRIAEALMDESDSIMYVAGMDNYELQYINAQAKKVLGLPLDEQNYIGRKCYELLQGMDAPCEFCKNSCLNRHSFYNWDHFNPKLHTHFWVRDKIITIDDVDYHFEIAVPANDKVQKQLEIERELEKERTLIKCVRSLESSLKTKEAVDSLLEIVTEYFNGDRAYLFEIDYEKQVTNNTYEWAAEGISKEIHILQDIPLCVIDSWMHTFKERGSFYISDLDENVDRVSDAYSILEAQGIRSLIAVPLVRNELIVGFFGVDNPRKNYQDFSLLASITYFIQNALDKRKNKELLEMLSYEDGLTGLYNRNKFNHVLIEMTENAPDSLAVVYLDLNGLKVVNDTYGHEQGDILIQTAARNIQHIFGRETYRIGGDEFVAFLTDITEDELQVMIKLMNEAMERDKVNISIGYCFRDAEVNVEEQTTIADKAMYAEKERYRKARISD